jgi:Hemerythrin HHE cation binding domain
MKYIGILSKLHEDHVTAEELLNQLEATEDDAEEREELFMRAKEEIMVHKVTEERVFYSRLLQHPDTRDIGKHCNEEHSEVDKLVDKLEHMDISSPKWLQTMSKLKKTILHHVEEEESRVFELAREAFGDEMLEQLGDLYEQEKLHVQATLRGESMAEDEVEAADLEEQSRQALYERAQAENIAGRSHMTKDELVGALRYGSP